MSITTFILSILVIALAAGGSVFALASQLLPMVIN